MRQSRITDPKELADKAVKDYEERFGRESEYDFFKKVLLRFNELKMNHTKEEYSDYIDITIRDRTFSFGFEHGKLTSIAT